MNFKFSDTSRWGLSHYYDIEPFTGANEEADNCFWLGSFFSITMDRFAFKSKFDNVLYNRILFPDNEREH